MSSVFHTELIFFINIEKNHNRESYRLHFITELKISAPKFKQSFCCLNLTTDGNWTLDSGVRVKVREVSENHSQSHEFGPRGLSATLCEGPLRRNLNSSLTPVHGGVRLTLACI